jgi:hypothetical protein
LLADYKKPEDIIGENHLLKQLTKAILERALEAELTDHRPRAYMHGSVAVTVVVMDNVLTGNNDSC